MVEAKGKKSKKDDIFESVSDSDSNSEDNNNDEDYKTYLSKLKLQELKALVMSLKNHFKFSMVGKKKDDFIEYILKYTKMEDGVIKLLEEEIKVINNLKKKKVSPQDQLIYIFKLKGRITKLKNLIDDNNIHNNNPKNEKNKIDNKPLLKQIKEIEAEVKERAKQYKEDKEKEEEEKKAKPEKEVDLNKLSYQKLRILLFGQSGKLTRLNKGLDELKGKTKTDVLKEIDEVKKYMNKIKEVMKGKDKDKDESSSESESESEEEEDKEDKIDLNMKHLFIDNKLYRSDDKYKNIKDYVKQHMKAPKKNVKGFFVSFKVEKDNIIVKVTETTITPKLFVGPVDLDFFQNIVVPKDKFNNDVLLSIFEAFNKELINFEKHKLNIKDVLKALKK